MSELCPFKPGQWVMYAPSLKGKYIGMSDPFPRHLIPGRRYEVVAVQKRCYVIVKGFEDHPGGGLYWTEFAGVDGPSA